MSMADLPATCTSILPWRPATSAIVPASILTSTACTCEAEILSSVPSTRALLPISTRASSAVVSVAVSIDTVTPPTSSERASASRPASPLRSVVAPTVTPTMAPCKVALSTEALSEPPRRVSALITPTPITPPVIALEYARP